MCVCVRSRDGVQRGDAGRHGGKNWGFYVGVLALWHACVWVCVRVWPGKRGFGSALAHTAEWVSAAGHRGEFTVTAIGAKAGWF
jgi:hypothetical protein